MKYEESTFVADAPMLVYTHPHALPRTHTRAVVWPLNPRSYSNPTTQSQTQRLASDTGRPRFALAVMMKNEEDVILRTLRSVEEWAHKVKLFDTGSTDTTLYLCKEWGRVTGVCSG